MFTSCKTIKEGLLREKKGLYIPSVNPKGKRLKRKTPYSCNEAWDAGPDQPPCFSHVERKTAVKAEGQKQLEFRSCVGSSCSFWVTYRHCWSNRKDCLIAVSILTPHKTIAGHIWLKYLHHLFNQTTTIHWLNHLWFRGTCEHRCQRTVSIPTTWKYNFSCEWKPFTSVNTRSVDSSYKFDYFRPDLTKTKKTCNSTWT